MPKKVAIVLAFAAAVICGALGTASLAPAQQVAPRVEQAYSQGLLWKIERPGVAPSHVFGTMHVSDSRVTALPDAVRRSFEGASSFAMEVLFDPSNVMQLATRMIYLDGRELTALTGQALYTKVAAAVGPLGLPPEVLRKFKPWAVALLLMVPQDDLQNILDHRLYRNALEQKKSVHQLETLDEQIDALEGIAESDQVVLLRAALAERERLPARTQSLINAYARRDLGELARISEEGGAGDPEMKRVNATLVKRLIDERNVRMAERMEPQLKNGRAFIAIGALHLYGERGVLARLASRDYQVSRVY